MLLVESGMDVALQSLAWKSSSHEADLICGWILQFQGVEDIWSADTYCTAISSAEERLMGQS
jgi:hypothetical protein